MSEIGDNFQTGAQTRAAPMRFIAEAARATGMDFDFLVRTAARESNFDTQARARTSSAAGLFQFIEQTWFAMMARHGEKHGAGDLSKAIAQRPDGRFEVADPTQRDAILDLRFDAALSSRLAAELAGENAAILRDGLGREPTRGELYAAHFLGARGAVELIGAAERDPGVRADALFPAAAEANRAIFYDGARARSASQVLDRLTRHESGATAALKTTGEAPLAAHTPRSAAHSGGAGLVARPLAGAVLSPALVEILASLDTPGGRKDEA